MGKGLCIPLENPYHSPREPLPNWGVFILFCHVKYIYYICILNKRYYNYINN